MGNAREAEEGALSGAVGEHLLVDDLVPAADEPYPQVLARVEAHLAAGELVAAAERLAAFLGAHPTHEQALLDLASVQAVAGALAPARATLEAALVHHPRSAAIAAKLTMVYRLLCDADPRDVESRCKLAALETAPIAPPVVPSAHALDLRPFFDTDLPYVVLRAADSFPLYAPRSDLDILCADLSAFRIHVLTALAPHLARGYRVDEERVGPHHHLDVYAPGSATLELRFDLTSTLALFEQIAIDPALTADVLAARERSARGGVNVSLPRRDHDLALRFLEYVEWQDRRPEKRKHLEAVDRANDFGFVDVVNGYTDLTLALDTSAGQAALDLGRKGAGEMADLGALRTRLAAPRVRMDYFMIWGHGLAHADEILEMIRAHGAFRVVTVVRHAVDGGDVAGFVSRVYEADTVPLQHLQTKTRYLLSTPPEILFVLVENRDARERYFGEGAFRHVQCANVKAVKDAVRDRFNPRTRDGLRSENHVIHGSDYEAQVHHLLAVLGLPPVAHYTREAHPDLDAPYHLAPIAAFEVYDLPLESLRASILGRGLVPLRETPHWQHLAGDPTVYRRYHAAHMGRALTDDHFPAAFDRLRARFDPDRHEHAGKLTLPVVLPLTDGTYRLLDGVHRAALALHMGRTTIRVAVQTA